eukprot:7601061-Pyramimonas_sp.AAC.1
MGFRSGYNNNHANSSFTIISAIDVNNINLTHVLSNMETIENFVHDFEFTLVYRSFIGEVSLTVPARKQLTLKYNVDSPTAHAMSVYQKQLENNGYELV